MKKITSLFLVLCVVMSLSACMIVEQNDDVPANEESNTIIFQNNNGVDVYNENIVYDNNANYVENNNAIDNNNEFDNNANIPAQNQTQTQVNSQQQITQSTTVVVTQAVHNHNYANATCTQPKKCSCGMTAGSALGHNYSSATCTSPKICSRCGIASGKELGHSYSNATCTSVKTCSRCGNTSGSALGHNYVNNKCSRCGKTDPNSLPVGLEKLPLIDNSGTLGYTYEYNSGSLTDAFGNSYIGYHFFRADDDGTYATFNLNNAYSVLSCDIVASQDMLSDGKVTIEVFVDDVLVYSKNNFSKTTGKVHANINVKNGSKLTIKATRTDGTWTYNANIALVNAKLTK